MGWTYGGRIGCSGVLGDVQTDDTESSAGSGDADEVGENHVGQLRVANGCGRLVSYAIDGSRVHS
jgi:hypothetical protein